MTGVSFTDEQFLTVMYRGLLGRDPDAGGLASHLARLKDGPADGAVSIVRGFIDSAEFQGLRAVADAFQSLPVQAQGQPFIHAASLGTDCYASMTLKKMGLKRYSLPFDWIFSTLPMILHCLEDDFQTFLDPRQYRSSPPAERSEIDIELCDHEFYRAAFGIPRMFNHFDPNDLAWHAYLVRAVARWRRLLASPQRKLFLAVVKLGAAEEARQIFPRLIERLEARTTHLCLRVLVVLPPAGPEAFGHEVLDRIGDHALSVLRPCSELAGIRFADAFDELVVRRLVARNRYDLADHI